MSKGAAHSHQRQGMQGTVTPVVHEMGRQCPIGAEIDLLLGLDSFWPDIGQTPDAIEALFAGLSAKFDEPKPNGLGLGERNA